MKGNVQHDVVQLLDKYAISEILDVVMDVAADNLVHEMRMWFDKEFGEGERLESALDKDVIEYVTHELEHHNARLVKHNARLDKLEQAIRPVSGEPTTGAKLSESDVRTITKDTINKTVKKLSDLERTIPQVEKRK